MVTFKEKRKIVVYISNTPVGSIREVSGGFRFFPHLGSGLTRLDAADLDTLKQALAMVAPDA